MPTAARAHPGESPSAGIDGDLMSVMRRIAGTSPLDIMKVRMIVEPQAASVAAATARDSDLETIRAAHDAARAALRTDVFEAWDGEFHKRIFASTRNEFLTTLHDVLKAIRSREQWLELKRRTFSEARRGEYCDQHAAILVAIEGRDPDRAATAMRGHMLAIHTNLFGALSGS